jgi:hypothetical protein
MYSYCCLCILIVVYVFLLSSLCILIVVYVFLLSSLCILIVVYVFLSSSLCILIVFYVFLLSSLCILIVESKYSYCCLCIFIVESMYSYCCVCILIVVYVRRAFNNLSTWVRKKQLITKKIFFIFQCGPLMTQYTSPTFVATTLSPWKKKIFWLLFKPGRDCLLDFFIAW